jgi:pyruvate,orthophosphate dikinase
VAASPGAAIGAIVFTAADAVAAAADGRDVILARPFTEADDVAGFHAAKGIVTSEGGKASPAALVARGMGVPAVTGASALEIDPSAGEVRVDGTTLHAGDRLAIEAPPAVTTDDVPWWSPGQRRSTPSCGGPTGCARCARAQRQRARGRAQGARVQRRGHRAVPHGAHVLR